MKRAIAITTLMALAGCSSTQSMRPVSLGILERAGVTRDQITAQFGPASASFEGDHVLAYRLQQGHSGYNVLRTTGWEGVNYDLILAFDESGVLSQHHMVPIHAPQPPH